MIRIILAETVLTKRLMINIHFISDQIKIPCDSIIVIEVNVLVGK